MRNDERHVLSGTAWQALLQLETGFLERAWEAQASADLSPHVSHAAESPRQSPTAPCQRCFNSKGKSQLEVRANIWPFIQPSRQVAGFK